VFPILFESSYFTLYSYPLFMGLAWGVAFAFTRFLFEKNSIDSDVLKPLFVLEFISTWIGAKIFFLWFSSEGKFTEYIYADNFWLGGGFVFYGGLIFGLVAFLLYSLVFKKFPFVHTKFLAPGLAIGHGIGRLGCFLTGCCYGSQCDLPWAIHLHGEFRHPVQLYEAAGLFFIAWLAMKWIRKNKSGFYVFTRYLLAYSILRFFVECFRGDLIRGVLGLNLSTSQWVSISLFSIILIAVFLKRKNE
jgi:phosphatidylglycerol:prolipoprotein diacylglycerol transferase